MANARSKLGVFTSLTCVVLAASAAFAGCSASSARENRVDPPAGGAGGNGALGGASGSGVGGASGASGASGAGGISIPDGGGTDSADCGGETFPLQRKPAKVLLVLDRSGSMEELPEGATDSTNKWNLVVPSLNQVITQTDAQIQWGLKTFPEGDTAYCTVTDAIDVQIAAANAGAVTGAITRTTPKGNGTPTGDAMKAAVKYLKSLDAAGDTDVKYILLATDGEPSCVGGSETSQQTARPYAVTAVTEAATANYHTFVIGVSTTKTNARQALNDMAVAGLEARPDPNPLATKFYLANTQSELVAAMSAITGVVVDCRFALTNPPPDGGHVGVRLGGETVPPESWDFVQGDRQTIEVTGEWCNRIKSGQADAVRIVFGCVRDPVR
jgi:hypothetical protein